MQQWGPPVLRRSRATKSVLPVGGEAALNFVPVYGQSLSLGATPTLISTDDRPTAKMFSGGLRWQYSATAADEFGSQASLVAMKEQADATGGLAALLKETVCCGFADMLYRLSPSHVLHMSTPGKDGTAIDGLKLGTDPFSRLIRQCDASSGLSGIGGWETRAMAYIQGESDYLGGMARATYAGKLKTLADDYATHARNGRQERRALTLIPQIASHLYTPTPTPTVALAQTDAAAVVGSLVRMACAMYQLTYQGDWHLLAADSRWLGAYLAVAYYHLCILGESWAPLTIESAVRDSTGITLTCHVPTPPLVLDTTWVTALADGNAGFQVVDSGGSPVTVTAVTLPSSTTVRLACSNGGGVGSVVRYGWTGTEGETGPGRTTGARGNLRDSAGGSLTFEIEEGDMRPMHNWCLISEVATT